MCIAIKMAPHEMESSVHGHHVYKDLWDALIGGDILMMKIDMLWLYSKDETTVGHIPRKISRICSVFSKG